MAFYNKMKDSISVTGQGLSQKAKNATENMRIGNLIKGNERMIEKLTYQVGVQCVSRHIEETDSEYAELFAEITRLKNENRDYQKELDHLMEVGLCPQCGFANNTTAKFCIRCGAPLKAAKEVPPEGRRCENCGAINEKDAIFCTECGSRFEEQMKGAMETAEPKIEPAENTCPNCGALLEEDVLFCIECGTKLDEIYGG